MSGTPRPPTEDGPERLKPRSVRKWVTDIHLYTGLLLSSYLVLYGVSSLQFNHPAIAFDGHRDTVTWQAEIPAPTEGEPWEAAATVREDLGLFGWVLPWTIQRDEEGRLAFELSRPGKEYSISIAPNGSAGVVERRTTLGSILMLLHGGRRVPGSVVMMTLWWLATLASVVVVVFQAAGGVYLWYVSKRDRVVGWSSVVVAFVSFFGLIAFMIL